MSSPQTQSHLFKPMYCVGKVSGVFVAFESHLGFKGNLNNFGVSHFV